MTQWWNTWLECTKEDLTPNEGFPCVFCEYVLQPLVSKSFSYRKTEYSRAGRDFVREQADQGEAIQPPQETDTG